MKTKSAKKIKKHLNRNRPYLNEDNVDKLFTKKDIKNIVDSVVERNQIY